MTRVELAARGKSPKFAPLTITTITMTGVFDLGGFTTIPIETLKNATDLAREMNMTVDEPKTKRRRKDAYVREVVPEKRRFRNQASLRHGGKSAKIFYNGSLHVTGCASPKDFVNVAVAVAAFVRAATGIELTPKSVGIQMINAGTTILDDRTGFPVRFRPRTLSSEAVAAGFVADFDSERHPGVKLPLYDEHGAKVATTCVFQTGSVSIIGARTPRHLAAAFENLVNVVGACAHIAEPSDAMRTTTSKKRLEFSYGYPSAAHDACRA